MKIKKVILVTGSSGFIGKNLISHLKAINSCEVLEFDLNNSIDDLEEAINKAEVIFHLAGSNRPVDVKEFNEINVGLTQQIINLARKKKTKTKIIFASSTQAALDNPYGRSKKEAEEDLMKFAESPRADIKIYRLANVFGKWCRPNYNSVTATFCYNIANNIEIKINDHETELNLIYIDDIVSHFIADINSAINKSPEKINVITPVYSLKLGELANKIKSFRESRNNLLLPEISDEFTKKLYTTYLSYLPENEFSYSLKSYTDNRGSLTELLKSSKAGQIFISTTKPGITRGNHYHHTKVEKFIVIKGEAMIKFRKIDSDNIIEYKVCGDKKTVVDIPPGYTHNITNTGKEELITLFWANEIFDKDTPDTFFEEV